MSWTIQILNVANIKLLLVAENSCQETKKNKKKQFLIKHSFWFWVTHLVASLFRKNILETSHCPDSILFWKKCQQCKLQVVWEI